MLCRIVDQEIKETAIGYDTPPFEGLIVEAPSEVLKNPKAWRYEDGEWVFYPPTPEPPEPPEPTEPTIEEILLAALMEIQELKLKVAELEGGQ